MAARYYFLEHLDARLDRKQRRLGVVARDRNDQPVEKPASALDQVQVAIGDRVKGSWIDRNADRSLLLK